MIAPAHPSERRQELDDQFRLWHSEIVEEFVDGVGILGKKRGLVMHRSGYEICKYVSENYNTVKTKTLPLP